MSSTMRGWNFAAASVRSTSAAGRPSASISAMKARTSSRAGYGGRTSAGAGLAGRACAKAGAHATRAQAANAATARRSSTGETGGRRGREVRRDGIIARASRRAQGRPAAMLYPLLRPFLFSLDPETAHTLAFGSLDVAARCHLAALALPRVPDDPVEVMGLTFPNRIGLAAGLDKNAEHIDGLAAFGFGHIECGTVTPRPQPGNPRPRLFRIVAAQALVNRMGFNNDGLEAFLANRARARWKGIVGLNIGKNFDTPNERAVDDYLACLRGCYAHASYVAVNVSSPNTKGLRDLQHEDALAALVATLKARAGEARAAARALHAARAQDRARPRRRGDRRHRPPVRAAAGRCVIATNTTIRRDGRRGPAARARDGRAVGCAAARARRRPWCAGSRARSTARCRSSASGGVLRGADAQEKLEAGAALVQVYTGLVYRGPDLVAECVRATKGFAAKPPGKRSAR